MYMHVCIFVMCDVRMMYVCVRGRVAGEIACRVREESVME